jgi:hypothetical protein
MDKLEKYRTSIVKILQEYAKYRYSYGDLERRFIISEDHNNFLLLTLGWQNNQRVHGCLVHVEILNDKVWIHRDGTEDGVTDDLVADGIPKSDIVLGFHHPELRQYTEYAVN